MGRDAIGSLPSSPIRKSCNSSYALGRHWVKGSHSAPIKEMQILMYNVLLCWNIKVERHVNI